MSTHDATRGIGRIRDEGRRLIDRVIDLSDKDNYINIDLAQLQISWKNVKEINEMGEHTSELNNLSLTIDEYSSQTKFTVIPIQNAKLFSPTLGWNL
jgi:hypothetical protein